MRIDPLRSTTPQSATRRADPADEGFALPQAEAAKPVTTARASSGVLGVDAILALQSLDGEGERRRRQARRGAAILDELDALQRALAAEEGAPERLAALARLMRDGEQVEDRGLESVLREIDVRAAVEIAKAERRARALAGRS